MALDLGGAVLGWLVADIGKAGRRGAASFLLGDALQRALESAVAAAVTEVIEGLTALNEPQRQHLSSVLTSGTGGGESKQWRVRNESDLRMAISSWVSAIDEAEFGTSYLREIGLRKEKISNDLTDAILNRVQDNARGGGPLGPLAEWIWRDETRGQLNRIESAVVQPAERMLSPVSLNPPLSRLEREPRLRGRTRVIKELTALLNDSENKRRTRVIHGLGGSGKTLVALTVAQEARAAGNTVWWVSATDTASFQSAMQALAVELGSTPEEIRLGSPSEVVWRKLATLTERWLLVVDNADDPQRVLAIDGSPVSDGRGWLRPIDDGRGTVLVTTRDGSDDAWGATRSSWIRLHQIKPLTARQGGQVLREISGAGVGRLDEAVLLSQRLGGLPLALRLVGKYLAESASVPAVFADEHHISTFEQFRKALDGENHLGLFANPFGPQISDTQARELIGYTWELSLTLLASRGLHQARYLLWLLSCFAGTPVQYRLLLELNALNSHPDFSEIDGRKLWKTLTSLADLGLIELNHAETSSPKSPQDVKGGQITIHPLVRDASFLRTVSEGKAAEYTALAIELMVLAVRDLDYPDVQASWPHWDKLHPHAFQLWDRVKRYPYSKDSVANGAHLADLSARYLLMRGLYSHVERRYRDLCRELDVTLGATDSRTLLMRHRLAHVLEDRGKFEESEAVHRDVLKIQGKASGEGARRTVVLRECLVSILKSQNRLDEAESECRAVIAAMIDMFGESSVYTLACRHHLAHVLLDQGRIEESRREHSRVVSGLIEITGPRDYNTLAARHCLATALGRTGRVREALAEYRSLVIDQVEALGELHQMTLNTHHQFAHLLDDLEIVDEAEEAHRAVLEARIRTLGEKHPHTLASRMCLAVHLRDRGELRSAVEECRIAVSSFAGTLETTHPQVISARWTLISVLEKLGDPAALVEAKELLDIALAMDVRNPVLISSCMNILQKQV